jgi:hypothetical protein
LKGALVVDTNQSAWPEDAITYYASGYAAGINLGRTQAAHDKFIAWCDGYNKGLAEGIERGQAMAWPQTRETG